MTLNGVIALILRFVHRI